MSELIKVGPNHRQYNLTLRSKAAALAAFLLVPACTSKCNDKSIQAPVTPSTTNTPITLPESESMQAEQASSTTDTRPPLALFASHQVPLPSLEPGPQGMNEAQVAALWAYGAPVEYTGLFDIYSAARDARDADALSPELGQTAHEAVSYGAARSADYWASKAADGINDTEEMSTAMDFALIAGAEGTYGPEADYAVAAGARASADFYHNGGTDKDRSGDEFNIYLAMSSISTYHYAQVMLPTQLYKDDVSN